jgi:hypothetical protein
MAPDAHTESSLTPSTAGHSSAQADVFGGNKKSSKPKEKAKIGQATISAMDKTSIETKTSKSSQSPFTASIHNPSKVPADMKTVKVDNLVGGFHDYHGTPVINKNDKNVAEEVITTTFYLSTVLESTEADVTPIVTKSWANVCSSTIQRKASTSSILQQKAVTQDDTASSRTPTTPAEFPALSTVSSGPTSLRIEPQKSGINQGTSISPTEKLQVVDDDGQHLAPTESVLSVADFPAVLPPSPPVTAASPSVSYAKVAQSPAKPDTPTLTETNVWASKEHSALVEQPLDNLYVMIRQERQGLLKGPQITIHSGTEAVTGIFKRAAMAASSVLNAHFVKNPEVFEYHLSPEDTVDPRAIHYLLVSYMHGISKDLEACAVPWLNTFSQNVALLRAARKLGMEPYTKHILTSHVIYLKDHIPSYEEIAIIERNKTWEKDPLWTKMLNNLCYARHMRYLPDPDNFEAFLEDHPVLRKAMEVTDSYFYSRSEERHAEMLRRNAEANETVEPAKRKADAQSGEGLGMVTVEEAVATQLLG